LITNETSRTKPIPRARAKDTTRSRIIPETQVSSAAGTRQMVFIDALSSPTTPLAPKSNTANPKTEAGRLSPVRLACAIRSSTAAAPSAVHWT
jgi:hypothetical protein